MAYRILLLFHLTCVFHLTASDTTPPANKGSEALQSIRVDETPISDNVHPEGAIIRIGSAKSIHGIMGTIVASPDGKWFAAPTYTKHIQVWEVSTDRLVRTIPYEGDYIWAIRFSRDGKKLAFGDGVVVKLFDLIDGKQLWISDKLPSVVYGIQFSPDGKTLVAHSYQQDLLFWNLDDGKLEPTLTIPKESYLVETSFSPTGEKILLRHYDTTISLWDVKTRKELKHQKFSGNGLSKIAFLPDGKSFAVHHVNTAMVLYDVESFQEIKRYKQAHFNGFFSDDYQLLAAIETDDSTKLNVSFIDLKTDKVIQQLPIESGLSTQILISKDKKFVSTFGRDKTLRRWDLASGKELTPRIGHQASVTGIVFTADSKHVISASQDGTIRFWDFHQVKETQRLTAKRQYFDSLAISNDSQVLAVGGNLVPGGVLKADSLHMFRLGIENPVSFLHFWDLKNNQVISQFDLAGESLNGMFFSSKDGNLITKTNDQIRLRDIKTGKEKGSISLATSWGIRATALSPDQGILATSTNEPGLRQIGKMAYWDLNTQKEIFSRTWMFAGFEAMAFTPDAKYLAVAGDNERHSRGEKRPQFLNLWKVPTDEVVLSFPSAKYGISKLRFSPDGRLLAGVLRNQVSIFETVTGQERRSFADHDQAITSIAFSPDGRYLATASEDTTMIVYDLSADRLTGKRIVRKYEKQQLLGLWSDLSEESGSRADTAIRNLAASHEQSIPMMKNQLTLLPEETTKRVGELIKQLDSSVFKTRELATRELENLSSVAAPSLKNALDNNPSSEMRSRLERIINKIGSGENPLTSSAARRAIRVVETLERIGTPEAMELLKDLTKRSTDVVYHREASAALKRLSMNQAK